MYKKFVSVLIFVIALTIAGNVSAATYEWDGGGDTNLFRPVPPVALDLPRPN